jgi:hypothetical protein
MQNFMNEKFNRQDPLNTLKTCLDVIIRDSNILDFPDLFEIGEIFHENAEYGIHRWSDEFNKAYHCDFYFEGYRAHSFFTADKQCIVSEKTLKHYLAQAVEWAKENRPEHKQFLIDFESKYLSNVENN